MSETPHPRAVFLSYAREDSNAARRIADALRAFDIVVWFDQNELRGGDDWDAKIRKQIRECSLFMPIISAQTQARGEGYFRREWKLAVERTHDMAEGIPFIVPVVVDDTAESAALVPDVFMRVQWTRLTHGVPSPQFVEQISRLLEPPRAGVLGPSRAAANEAGTRRGRHHAWWWFAAAAAVALVGAGRWLGVKQHPANAALTPEVRIATAAPSQSRELVAKARGLYERWDLAPRQEFQLAEELLKKAIELDPSDGDTWSALALVDCGYVVMSVDSSDARKAAAKAHAERALKLAPASAEARFAHAFALRFRRDTEEEAVRMLREEAGRQPNNRMVLRALGGALRQMGQYEQSLVYFEKSIALPGPDPIGLFNRGMGLIGLGRMAEAEASIDEALALEPKYRGATSRKLSLLLDYHGDLEGARSLLMKSPANYGDDDVGIMQAATIWLYCRDPKKCLEVLKGANDYMASSRSWSGPKAAMTGAAHILANNLEAARSDWRAALQLVEQTVTAPSRISERLWWTAYLHALLTERSEAEALLSEIFQRREAGDGFLTHMRMARLTAQLQQDDKAVAEIEAAMKAARTEGAGPTNGIGSRYTIRNELRYDPMWDRLRAAGRLDPFVGASKISK